MNDGQRQPSQQQQPIRVLLVEDNPADARLLVEALKDVGPDAFRVTHVARLAAALDAVARTPPPDLVLLDISLPDSSGLPTVERVRSAAPDVPIVVLTGLQDEQFALQAVQHGVQDYLVKGQCEGDLAARAIRYAAARRRAEAALHESEQKYRVLTTATSDAIYRMSPDWAEMRQLGGRGFIANTPEPSRTWLEDYIHPDDQPAVREAIRQAIRSKHTFELEHRVIRADGTLGWTQSRAIPILNERGEIVEWFGAASDVTERKAAEEALHESEKRFRALSEATFDPLVLHEGGRVIEVNQAFVNAFGYRPEEIIGRDALETLVSPESRAMMAERIRTGSEQPYEVVSLRKDGSTFLSEVRARNTVYRGRAVRVASVHDVTERKAAEEALRAAEAQLRTITDAAPALIGYVDRAGVYRLNNRAYETWFGQPRESMTGRHIKEALGPAAWREVRPRLERALAGEEVRYEDLLRYAGGGPRWVSVTYTPDRGPGGDVRGAVILVTDIGAIKAAEQALRESEERFRALADGSPALIWVNGPDGAEFVNRAYLEFVGATAEENVKGFNWAQFVHPDDRDDYVDAYLDCVGRRCHFEADFRFRRHDGEYRWMKSTGVPRVSGTGELLGYAGSTIDITGIREAQRRVLEEMARHAAVVSTAVDAIITIDERGVIDSVNPSTARLFGYAAAELIGQNVNLLMPEPYRGEHDEYLRRYLRTGKANIIGIGREVLGLRKDGTTFPLELSVSEFHVGTRRMFTGILHDLTKRRRLEREVLEASANEQRRIGHDLHDGICQQILGASFGIEVLARRLEGSAPREVESARKLLDLLNDTLTQARALAHGLNPIDLRAGGLAKALQDLCGRVGGMFHTRCSFTEEGHVELTDNAVATHLYRIAQEAISNAIKHGKAKHIRIGLTGTDGSLTLSVRDDGTGLRPKLDRTAGHGLEFMQYRAGLIGATLAVRPGESGGTAVTCSLRISRAKPAASEDQAHPKQPIVRPQLPKPRVRPGRRRPDPA